MEDHNYNSNEGQNKASLSLLSLNEHCLLKIFDYLYIVDTVNLSLACKKMMKIAQMAVLKYKEFSLSEYQSYVKHNEERNEMRKFNERNKVVKSMPLGAIIILLSPTMESLNLQTNLLCSNSRKEYEWELIKNFKFMKLKTLTVRNSSAFKWINADNIEELEIRRLNPNELNNFKLTKLKKFTIADISKDVSLDEIYDFLEKNPNIEYIKFEDVLPYDFKIDIFPRLWNLKELEFCIGKGVPDLMDLLQIEQLTVLKLEFRESFSHHRPNNNSRIKVFLEKLSVKKTMETLELRGMQFEDYDVFDALSLSTLISLHLIKPIIRVENFYWKLATTPFLRLRRLDMSGILYIDTVCLIEQLKTLERLTLVDHYTRDNMTDFFKQINSLLIDSSRTHNAFELVLTKTTHSIDTTVKKVAV